MDNRHFVFLALPPAEDTLAAENLFLRKQLAFYQERRIKPRRIDPASKLFLILLSKLLDWKETLASLGPRP